ncbi:GTP1/OBG family protein [Cavenderia fasciculata]|uniref:GTP1/OBG family protein n=1 Tax=Cavenderia fasciculata TaxID=261658 RepID=F4PKM6_CACFS|nr:GTP1/OBG family protein [Cavenderia fasciculata]EGG24150.1 GTP1/OBG family protein [Cavenderia fasciculata]|eukprot:XP_004362001.1 GTP1/OBG family protein [Cavenderia fasciculata]
MISRVKLLSLSSTLNKRCIQSSLISSSLNHISNNYSCKSSSSSNTLSSLSTLNRYNHIHNHHHGSMMRYYSSDKESGIQFQHSESFKELLENMDGDQLRDYAENVGAINQIEQKDATYSNLSFMDKIRIKCKAGDGGAGCVNFFRAKYIPLGPPDGGNGGNGASIIIRSDLHENNLAHLERHYVGDSGEKGKGAKKTGKDGDDIIIHVPPGTIIREVEHFYGDAESLAAAEDEARLDPNSPTFDPEYFMQKMNEPVLLDGKKVNNNKQKAGKRMWKVNRIVGEMHGYGEEIVLLQGGRGGKGNANFATGRNRSPEYAQPGLKGGDKYFELELKIIADVGLVGYPNAGKSTLLSRVSNAIPKIRNYAFTTLHPYVGVMDFPHVIDRTIKLSRRGRGGDGSAGSSSVEKAKGKLEKATMADLPGILEGAHLNIGLGLDFLKHIERTKVLCYVIDMSNEGVPSLWDGKKLKVKPDRYKKIREDQEKLKEVTQEIRARSKEMEQRSPWGDFVTLLEELENYQPGLTKKPSIIIANKMDGPFSQDHLDVFKKATAHLIDKENTTIIPISAYHMDDNQVIELKTNLKKLLEIYLIQIREQQQQLEQEMKLAEENKEPEIVKRQHYKKSKKKSSSSSSTIAADLLQRGEHEVIIDGEDIEIDVGKFKDNEKEVEMEMKMEVEEKPRRRLSRNLQRLISK